MLRRSPLVSGPGRRLHALAVAALWAAASMGAPAWSAPVKTEHAEVELLSEHTALTAGEANTIGLAIQHAPKWHSYWQNPGDAGYPTKITWQLPSGYGVGDIQWPTPKRLPTGPIINFGYDGEVLLPMTLSVPRSARVGEPVTLRGKAEWLVCKDVCVPEEAELALTLPVADGAAAAAPGPAAARFAAARAARPGDASAWKATLHAAPHPEREAWLEVVAPSGAGALRSLDVFPVPQQVTDPAVQQVYRTARGYAVRLKLAKDVVLGESMPIVLAASGAPLGARGEPSGQTLAAVSRSAFALPADARVLAAEPVAADGAGALTLGVALLLALIGGAILNLMPCVFPVLSLKILSFVQHAGSGADARRKTRAHGLFYAFGVVLSFLLLAGLLLGLKAAGGAIGWGFQLQNPIVVWALAVIFFLIGLNLIGAFEVGQLAPSALLSLTARHPGLDAFFAGVLAVIAASPCTAPFMGAALGFALTQSAPTALAVFAALGVGMALPYVLLAWFPGWLDRLPKPGPWMLTLKQVLAFPLFLTVVWLIWVLSIQAGANGAAIALTGLVVLAFGAWLIGARRSAARWVGVLVLLLAALAAAPSAQPGAATVQQGNGEGAVWQPWDPARIAALTAERKPVFVDFTAAWCVSCQANKRLVLGRDDIERAFADKGVTLMRADWTNRDERITRALAAMGRSGVPVYALYVPGKPPLLLPELLTPGIVRDALAKL